jgi:pimeloyl-ACP methyl ester carboxylesterase
MGQLFTAERAREFGIISSEFQMPEGKTKIQVLCIGFYGVDNLAKTREAAIDVLGGTPPLLQEAENFTNQRLKTLQRYVAADVCVVPYFIGHSMGGMVAQAMGAAFNAGSVALNPLGMGSGCQGFVEKKARGALGRAMDAAHASMHIAFCSDGDWLRPPIRKPILGQPYRMELAAEFAKDSLASIHNGSVRQYCHWWKQRG